MPNNQDRLLEVGTFGMPLPQRGGGLYANEDMERFFDFASARRHGGKRRRLQMWREDPRYQNMIGYLRRDRVRMERLAIIAEFDEDPDDHVDFIWN